MGKADRIRRVRAGQAAGAPGAPSACSDYRHVYTGYPADELTRQASRCMDCGVPFCHQGCPLGNLIPDWNDLVYRDSWRTAIERLHQTNNFPEFTGLLCPAPCEGSCVLGINKDPVTIKAIELAIVDRAFDEGWIVAEPPRDADVEEGGGRRLGSRRARRRGAAQSRRPQRDRVREEPIASAACCATAFPSSRWRSGCSIAGSICWRPKASCSAPGSTSAWTSPADDLRRDFDAVLLAGGAGRPRDLEVPGRIAVRRALRDGLPHRSRTGAARATRWPRARRSPRPDKHVMIIGGGDTGADCLGTVHRQGARVGRPARAAAGAAADARRRQSLAARGRSIFRTSSAHEEGGDRVYAVATSRL